MPELPEVEAVRRELQSHMEGARFERVVTNRPDLREPFPRDFSARLEGRRVRALRRRAKYLMAELSSGETLLMHLGMSGSFRVETSGSRPVGMHDHVVFRMSSGATIVFNDPRRFGVMRIVPSEAEDAGVSALGPEPLDSGFSAAALAAALTSKKTSLKVALLDQRVVAGLGNIYVCEALHRARLSPTRRASTLTTRSGAPRPAARELVIAIRTVLTKAIDRAHHYPGNDRFRVYDREAERCPRRGCRGTIKRITQAGRSTFFCPACQR